MSKDEHDFLPEASWCISTHPQLKSKLKLLTPEKLDEVCPQLKEWRERAIELQLEPAAMAAEQFRLMEENARLIRAREEACHVAWHEGVTAAVSYFGIGDPGALHDRNPYESPSPFVSESGRNHLYRNSEVIYCAPSLARCWELFTHDTGLEREDEEESDPFEQIPDGEMVEIASEDSSGSDNEELRVVKNKDGKDIGAWWFEKKTAGEWAELSAVGHFSGGDI